MATRPIFKPSEEDDFLVNVVPCEFTWNPGLAPSQKKKNIQALHESATSSGLCSNLLEISTKSEQPLGQALSAFRLSLKREGKRDVPVECLFQAGKQFKKGGPYRDLLDKQPRDAKRDPRLLESGELLAFRSNGHTWPLEPKTAFYDWVYLKTLGSNPGLESELVRYDGFTDIEFNPKKSINCQAYSVALYVSLRQRKLLDEALDSPDGFLSLMRRYTTVNARDNDMIAPRLLM